MGHVFGGHAIDSRGLDCQTCGRGYYAHQARPEPCPRPSPLISLRRERANMARSKAHNTPEQNERNNARRRASARHLRGDDAARYVESEIVRWRARRASCAPAAGGCTVQA